MTHRTLFVAGVPQPQGSMRAFNNPRGGQPIVTSDNPKNKIWRTVVGYAFQQEFQAVAAGPVTLRLVFVMPRPKAMPKSKTPPHTSRPDLDKLCRSIFDAGSKVVWADDTNIDTVSMRKRYALPGEQSGAHITIEIGQEP